MTPSSESVLELLRLSFADSTRWPRWPKPLHLLQGTLLVQSGADVSEAAKVVGTTAMRLMEVATAPDPVQTVLRVTESDLKIDAIARLKRNVGQLVLARAAEMAFQSIFEAGIDPKEFSIVDVREGRTNTDFRLLNGGGRPLYRFNVKFFGSVFRRGAEMVRLSPSDCFPLATYKIMAALQEQEKEHLPYVFAIVGVADLNAAAVAAAIPEQEILPLAWLFSSPVITRKRDFEDWLVDRIVAAQSPAFATAYQRIKNTTWYVLSARRANDLMHKLCSSECMPFAYPDLHANLAAPKLICISHFLKIWFLFKISLGEMVRVG